MFVTGDGKCVTIEKGLLKDFILFKGLCPITKSGNRHIFSKYRSHLFCTLIVENRALADF